VRERKRTWVTQERPQTLRGGNVADVEEDEDDTKLVGVIDRLYVIFVFCVIGPFRHTILAVVLWASVGAVPTAVQFYWLLCHAIEWGGIARV